MKRFSCSLPLMLAIGLGSIIVFPAMGQESKPATNQNEVVAVTIESLVAEVLAKNPEQKFYEAEIVAAKAGRKTAALWQNPELNASVGHKRTEDQSSALAGEGVAWSASLLQPFEWPGRIGLRKAIANRDIELAELGLKRFRTALAGQVRSRAYALLAAQEKATATREVADRFQSLREVMVQRDPAGLTPLLETRVIEATELTTQRKASEATLAHQAALLELNQLRGAAPETPLTIQTSPQTFPPIQNTGTLIATARTNNFDVRLRAAELAQQGFRVDLAKNERFPSLKVGPSYSEERAGDRERIISVGISLPLPLWNRNSGNIEAATARQLQAETSLAVLERDVERKVVEASSAYETRVKEMSKWRPDATQHFQEAAELADRHYRLGAVPIATYVELQKQYLEAVEALFDGKKEAMEALQQLQLLTGMDLNVIQAAKQSEEKK